MLWKGLRSVKYVLVSWIQAQEHMLASLLVVLGSRCCPAVCSSVLVVVSTEVDRPAKTKECLLVVSKMEEEKKKTKGLLKALEPSSRKNRTEQ